MPNQQAPIWKVLQPTKPKIELNEINDLLLANVGGHLHHPPFAVVNLVLSVSRSVSLTFLLHYIPLHLLAWKLMMLFKDTAITTTDMKIVEESFLGILRLYVTRVWFLSHIKGRNPMSNRRRPKCLPPMNIYILLAWEGPYN